MKSLSLLFVLALVPLSGALAYGENSSSYKGKMDHVECSARKNVAKVRSESKKLSDDKNTKKN